MLRPYRPTTKRQVLLTLLIITAVIAGLALAIIVPAGVGLDAAVDFLSRWFFAFFCTLFALVQARVYQIRRRHAARLAREIPAGAFGLFTLLWLVLAVAAVVYGILDLEGWWEVAAWATVVVVICVQLLVLGGLQRRSES